MSNISDRIKSLRLSAGMTQEEFGRLFGIVKSTVSLYENGKSTPNDQIKEKICEHFGISLDNLMGKEDVRIGRKEGFFTFYFDSLMKETFTSQLNEILSEKKLTLEEFSKAAAIRESECSAYLNGDCKPPLEHLVSIASTLGVSIDYLLGLIDYQTEKVLSAFRQLNEDNKDICVGEIKRTLRDQRREESVAADTPLKKAN